MKNNEDMIKQYLYNQATYINNTEKTNKDEAKDNIPNENKTEKADEKVVNKEMEQEYNKFMSKLEEFNNISRLQDAKDCAKRLFNIDKELNFFRAGEAYITIESRADLLRIIVNSEGELLCYNFRKQSEPQTQQYNQK